MDATRKIAFSVMKTNNRVTPMNVATVNTDPSVFVRIKNMTTCAVMDHNVGYADVPNRIRDQLPNGESNPNKSASVGKGGDPNPLDDVN